MNQENIQLNNRLIFKKSIEDTTLTLSKTQLGERYDMNIKQIINGFKNVPSFIEAQKSFEKDSFYKVIIPKDISKKLEDGSAHWNIDKSGMKLPTIKDQKGSFICQARLEETKPEYFSNFNDIALQSTMAAVLEQLETLNEQVFDVIQGQLSDRIGIIRGAEETYKQALLVQDINIRKQLLSQSISELNKGRCQLIESLESKTKFIHELPQSTIKQIFYSLFQKIDPDKINKKFHETQRIFDNIIRSSSFIALAYEELGEMKSLQQSLLPLKECIREYSTKIKTVEEFIPYDSKFENKYSWYKNPENTIQMIDSNFNKLTSAKSDYLEIQIKGEQLLLTKEDTYFV